MFILYDFVFIMFAILYLPIFILKGKFREGLGMRLGFFPSDFHNPAENKTIWLHAVSVGEVNASSLICKGLKAQFPSHRLIISTTTQTGNRIAKKLFSQDAIVSYFPLDLSFVVSRWIKRIKPSLFVITETEIWPNLIAALWKRKVPIALVNGRISPSSFRRYKLIRPILKGILKGIDLFCMQTQDFASKMVSLGAPPERVRVTGNMKFDIKLPVTNCQLPPYARASEGRPELKKLLKLTDDQQLFVGGSTHPGEEKILLEVYKALMGEFPNLKVLIAPRHIERIRDLERLVVKNGFKSVRISQLQTPHPTLPPSADRLPSGARERVREKQNEEGRVFLLDTMGKLQAFYSIATIVFVGGSLVPRGGQNLIEPASLSKPIIFGPNVFNFKDIADLLLERDGAIVIRDQRQLQVTVRMLLNNPQTRQSLGQKARQIVEENRGATRRNIELIKELILPR